MEEKESILDFDWFTFIGRTKLGLTTKETMRLTPRKFTHLYKIYKKDFDAENYLRFSHQGYEQLEREQQKRDLWF